MKDTAAGGICATQGTFSSSSPKSRFFVLKFLEVYILATTYQKAFILSP